MGMFDEIRFRCNRCGGAAKVQTKAGPCVLAVWTPDEIPPEHRLRILADIQGEYANCEECGGGAPVRVGPMYAEAAAFLGGDAFLGGGDDELSALRAEVRELLAHVNDADPAPGAGVPLDHFLREHPLIAKIAEGGE